MRRTITRVAAGAEIRSRWPPAPARRRCSRAFDGHEARACRAADRLGQGLRVAQLRRQAGPFEQGRDVVRLRLRQIRRRSGGPRRRLGAGLSLQLLDQREARLQVVRVELDRPPQVADRLGEPAPALFQEGEQALDRPAVGRKRPGLAPGRRRRLDGRPRRISGRPRSAQAAGSSGTSSRRAGQGSPGRSCWRRRPGPPRPTEKAETISSIDVRAGPGRPAAPGPA